MKRSKHGLSHYKLCTMDMGELIPVSCVDVLPGDTFQGHTSALIRVSPLVAPVMHPVTVRLHTFFTPYRILWDGWEDFITGGPDGQGGDAGAFPTVSTTGATKGGLLDYLGVPPVTGVDVSALPIRAYNKIFNEYFRDQDLVPEATEDALAVHKIAWEKDYFTSARPWPQKGPDVVLPLGATANVVSNGNTPTFSWQGGLSDQQLYGNSSSGALFTNAGGGNNPPLTFGTQTGLTADLATATGATINDLRRAAAIQRYQEMRAMYGSRYTEYLRAIGVRSSDSRLQRPEYVGGGKQVISFSEVLRTGAESDIVDPTKGVIGEMKGHGIAALRQNRWRRFFEEHGVLLTLMSVRPRTMYANYLDRMWSKRTKEDYWQRELEHIGHQEVYRREVYAEADAGGATVFGYNDRYAEYRHIQSQIAGDFRDTLNFWHLARDFTAAPALNQSFVECDPSKRIHAVQTEDVLWAMVNNSLAARRLVSKRVSYRIF